MSFEIESITLKLTDGQEIGVSFFEYGWQQWGGNTETLGITMAVPEALQQAAREDPELAKLLGFTNDEEE